MNCRLQLQPGVMPSPTAGHRKGLAVTSLVLGIISLVTVGGFIVLAILGLTFGIIAYRSAKNRPNEYGGSGVALAGIITSAVSVLIIVPVGIIAAIAIPNLLASRQAANEASAIRTLRRIAVAEATYQASTGRGQSFGTLEQLVASGLIENVSVRSGYEFKVTVRAGSFEVTATPQSYGQFGTGRRSFYVCEDYVIRGADRDGLSARRSDPPLE
jgi:type II secretory pathway pseudopilin PulG